MEGVEGACGEDGVLAGLCVYVYMCVCGKERYGVVDSNEINRLLGLPLTCISTPSTLPPFTSPPSPSPSPFTTSIPPSSSSFSSSSPPNPTSPPPTAAFLETRTTCTIPAPTLQNPTPAASCGVLAKSSVVNDNAASENEDCRRLLKPAEWWWWRDTGVRGPRVVSLSSMSAREGR